MKNKLILHSLGHAVLVLLYISGVAWVMSHGKQIFGEVDNTFWIPVAFLTTFVLSAAITGSLVLGRPILLYLDGKKKEALVFFGYTLAWLAAILILLLIIQPWR